MAMSLGVPSAYIGVSCTQTIDSTRQGADCYCRRSPRLVNQLCVRACGKSARSCRDSTPPCLCVNASSVVSLWACVCVCARACACGQQPSTRGTMSTTHIHVYTSLRLFNGDDGWMNCNGEGTDLRAISRDFGDRCSRIVCSMISGNVEG